jgi:hypothetical protein
MGVTIYRCQIQAIIKLPIKKVLIKLRVLSDDSVPINVGLINKLHKKS